MHRDYASQPTGGINMVRVIGVRFKKAGKIYYFDPDDIDIQEEQDVIVETARGVEFGQVVVGPKDVTEEEIVSPLKKVLRIATTEDVLLNKENNEKEDSAFKTCLEKIQQHGLDMKLIDVEYTFDNNKVIFYFTADGRVDFRDLVKDLASIFRTRIELRQIGVRDEAKMIGGIGPCGITLCCSTWLGEFEPVSIKMAKDQNLSLNPNKISGICGRLLCCLRYEHETYLDLKEGLPEQGEKIKTPEGLGIVIDSNTLLESVKVRLIVKQKNGSKNNFNLSDDVYLYHKTEIERMESSKKVKEEDNDAFDDDLILDDE